MLMTAMSMLVSSVNNPDAVREEIRAVAMRHIKYSLSPEDFEVFGKVLVAALREAVGEQSWDEETQGAWTDIFEMISEVFMQVRDTAVHHTHGLECALAKMHPPLQQLLAVASGWSLGP